MIDSVNDHFGAALRWVLAENYGTLISIHRFFMQTMEDLFSLLPPDHPDDHSIRPRPTARYSSETLRAIRNLLKIRRALPKGYDYTTEVAFESAGHSLGRCVDLVEPAGELSSTKVSRQDWCVAVRHLRHFLKLTQDFSDPDLALSVRTADLQWDDDDDGCDGRHNRKEA